MKELTVFEHNHVDVVDSRQVAEMIGKDHAHLMRDIAGYAKIIESSSQTKFGLADFFIPSTYKDAQDKPRPCYLLTKKGCDMVANKMTGEKGVLFTAAYVTAFEAMRQHIQSEAAPKISPDKEERAKNAAKLLHIMELNAKSRAASQMQRLWNAAGIQPQYQALTLNGYLDGLSLPQEAFSGVCTHMLDATTIAKNLNIYSKSGKPHAKLVGAVISTLELLPGESAETPYSRNGHDGVSTQYATSVQTKVWQWFEAAHWPAALDIKGRHYNIVYTEPGAVSTVFRDDF